MIEKIRWLRDLVFPPRYLYSDDRDFLIRAATAAFGEYAIYWHATRRAWCAVNRIYIP